MTHLYLLKRGWEFKILEKKNWWCNLLSAYLKGSFQVQISVIVIVSDKLDKNWEKTDEKYV